MFARVCMSYVVGTICRALAGTARVGLLCESRVSGWVTFVCVLGHSRCGVVLSGKVSEQSMADKRTWQNSAK